MANENVNTRGALNLPAEVSDEVLQKTQEASAIMQMARPVQLPGRGLSIPTILSDPEAGWVAEGGKKPVSKGSTTMKELAPYKLAVIVPFSDEFRRDAESLYKALIQRLPAALGAKFDNTVIGGTAKPGDKFDNFAGATAQVITKETAYQALVSADTDVAVHGGITNGYVLSPQMRGLLLSATDDTKRPLFINSVAEGAVPQILGSKAITNKGAYAANSPEGYATVGVGGDWTQAVYGTVNGVQVSISDQATLEVGDETINLFQQNMFAVRAEIEVGFRADIDSFNIFTVANA